MVLMPHGMVFFVALRDGTDSSQGGLATQEKGAGFEVPWDGTDASRDGFFFVALRDVTDASQGGLATQGEGAGCNISRDEVDASRDGFNA